jgi:hypothetical protein
LLRNVTAPLERRGQKISHLQKIAIAVSKEEKRKSLFLVGGKKNERRLDLPRNKNRSDGRNESFDLNRRYNENVSHFENNELSQLIWVLSHPRIVRIPINLYTWSVT